MLSCNHSLMINYHQNFDTNTHLAQLNKDGSSTTFVIGFIKPADKVKLMKQNDMYKQFRHSYSLVTLIHKTSYSFKI